MLKTPLGELPFWQVSINVVGPLCTTSKNNRFILCVVDSATRWAKCYPVPGHTSASKAKAMTNYIARYGIVNSILTDLDADMTSKLLNTYFSFFGINHLQCIVAHAQSNGTVEGFNGTLKNMLRICNDVKE